MTEEVLVKITSIQRNGAYEESEPISIMTPGRYFTNEGNAYVRYEEVMDEEGLSTVNTAKIHPDYFELKKNGAVNVHMLFQNNKKNISYYETPFGQIEMGISTTSYRKEETEDKISVFLRYAMEMNGEHTADCELTLEILAKGTAFSI